MAKHFDPYHKWLGIAPEERLPTHYRLLGLNLFESDTDVIEAAADRQMTYLQEVSQGSEVEQAQKLLAEVAEARLCLLNQEKKSVYDARLREQLASIEGGQRLRQQTKSQAKSANVDPEPRLVARKRKPATSSPTAQKKKTQQQKKVQQSDASAGALLESKTSSRSANRGMLWIAGAGGTLLLVGVTFFLFGGGAVTDSPSATAQKSATMPSQSEPSVIPPIGSGRKITVQPDSALKKGNKPSAESIEREVDPSLQEPDAEESEEENAEDSAAAGQKNAEDEKESADPDKATSSAKKDPLRFVELEVLPKDDKTKFRYGSREGFYVVVEESTAKPYRLKIKAPSGPFIGLCLEVHGAEHESATLASVEVTSPKKVSWSRAADSLGQGSAAALVANETEWRMSYNGKDPIWAVFIAEKPFGKIGPQSLKIELDHSDAGQRLHRFRLWGITGSGTLEEMAQVMRDRALAKNPFADFIAHGLPEGSSGEVSLGSVFIGSQQLQAQLFGGSKDSGGARFTLKKIPAVKGDALQRWEFLLDQQTPVAELIAQGEKQAGLTLRWLPIAAQLPRAVGLHNGLLQLGIGEQSRSVPLREIVELVPLTYSPLKTVRPQVQVPIGIAAEDLRLALQFPESTFGVDQAAVLQVGGPQAEGEVTLKDGMVLKLNAAWKEPIITLTVKTLMRERGGVNSDKQKAKAVPLPKMLKEIPKLNKRYEESKKVIAFIEKMEKFAGRTYLRKPEDKRDWNRISKQWYAMGLPPPKRIDKEAAKKLLANAQVAQAEIKKNLQDLKDLQQWVKPYRQNDGSATIEFRVYTLLDGVPLDLVRSTGWKD